MGHFEQILATLVEKALTDLAIPEDQIESARGGIAQDIMAQFTEEMRDDLLRRAPAILKRERRDTQGFEKRNLERWRSAFDLVELIWIVAAELGSNFNNELRDQAQQDNDYLFEALTHLHARALLVSNEALCLMKGGFPDGALSRWRTLHEHSVIAMFLKMHGSEAAHRYLASFDFQALKSARQMREYAERARIEPPSDAEIEYLEECCKRWTSKFYEEMREEYGWTFPILGKKRANLFDLEEATGLDHWRPRFRWASQHTHGQHRPAQAMLGVVESTTDKLLIGQSNSGLVDPLQMTAMGVASITACLLLSKPNVDRAVAASVLMRLSDDVGPTAIRIEKETFERAQGVVTCSPICPRL